MSNKEIICYDMLLVPSPASFEQLFEIMKKTNVLFYDSFNAIRIGSPKPYPYMLNGSEPTKALIDISTEEGKVIYEKVIKELNNE